MTQSNPPDTRPPALPEQSLPLEEDQSARLRKLGMAVVSYLATLLLVFFFYRAGLLPMAGVIGYAVLAALLSLGFFLLIRSDRNLKFADPSMAFAQIVCSVIPSLPVLCYLENGQARGVVLMLAVVPVTYGVMTLGTATLIRAILSILAGYLLSLVLLWLTNDRVVISSLEALQVLAVLLVSLQVVWLGSHINRLRNEVLARNRTLNLTMSELHEALETIQALATRDELTGLFNRRHLQNVLAQELARFHRDGQAFSVCLLDIDHFKQINDSRGHEAGDKVLRTLAESIQTSVRSVDCFGRFGGEEFLLILPATSLAGAQQKAERLRQLVEALEFPELGSDLRVTVSIGVAEAGNEPFDATLRRADTALYVAKKAGRNRVMA